MPGGDDKIEFNGNGVDWTLENGVMTIFGGEVGPAFDSGARPWAYDKSTGKADYDIDNKLNELVTKIVIADKLIFAGDYYSDVFGMFYNLEKITGLENVDFSNVDRLFDLFNYDTKLKSVDLTGTTFKQGVDLEGLFASTGVEKVNLGSLDLSQLPKSYSHSWFDNTPELVEIDMSNIIEPQNSNVIDLQSEFGIDRKFTGSTSGETITRIDSFTTPDIYTPYIKELKLEGKFEDGDATWQILDTELHISGGRAKITYYKDDANNTIGAGVPWIDLAAGKFKSPVTDIYFDDEITFFDRADGLFLLTRKDYGFSGKVYGMNKVKFEPGTTAVRMFMSAGQSVTSNLDSLKTTGIVDFTDAFVQMAADDVNLNGWDFSSVTNTKYMFGETTFSAINFFNVNWGDAPETLLSTDGSIKFSNTETGAIISSLSASTPAGRYVKTTQSASIPTEKSTVAEIKSYLTENNVDFEDNLKKADLLKLVK